MITVKNPRILDAEDAEASKGFSCFLTVHEFFMDLLCDLCVELKRDFFTLCQNSLTQDSGLLLRTHAHHATAAIGPSSSSSHAMLVRLPAMNSSGFQ